MKRAWYLPDKYLETGKDWSTSDWSALLIIIWRDDGGMWCNDDMTNWSRWSLSYFGIRRNVVLVLSSNHFSSQHLNNHPINRYFSYPNMPMLNSRTFQSASGVNTITRPVPKKSGGDPCSQVQEMSCSGLTSSGMAPECDGNYICIYLSHACNVVY